MIRSLSLVASMALCFWSSGSYAENENFEFGVEQEVSSFMNPLTIAPLVDLALGIPAKEYDWISRMAGRSYLDLVRRQSHLPGAPVVQGRRVYYPEFDWGFSVTPDYTTVEMVFEPMTLGVYRQLEDRLQRDLWETAAKRRLFPRQYFSAGHVHIGTKNFQNDPGLFLNYIIDFANHSELYFGILGFDPINALPPLQNDKHKAVFRALLRDFDAGRVDSIEEIQKRLHVLPGFGKPRAGLQGALNLRTRFPTIEFRALRSHRSARHLGAFLELQAQRIRYLSEKGERLAYVEPTITVDSTELIHRFAGYLSEMGASREQYALLLPRGWAFPEGDVPHPSRIGPRNSTFLGRCYLLYRAL